LGFDEQTKALGIDTTSAPRVPLFADADRLNAAVRHQIIEARTAQAEALNGIPDAQIFAGNGGEIAGLVK